MPLLALVLFKSPPIPLIYVFLFCFYFSSADQLGHQVIRDTARIWLRISTITLQPLQQIDANLWPMRFPSQCLGQCRRTASYLAIHSTTISQMHTRQAIERQLVVGALSSSIGYVQRSLDLRRGCVTCCTYANVDQWITLSSIEAMFVESPISSR